jgi:1D-myo-inositol-triphosphate 3-kinase
VHGFIAGFHGTVQETEEMTSTFLCLENVVHGFKEPMVMDVKLGMRTHLQSEGHNDKPRADLFKKMAKSFPSHLTPAEVEAGMVTKTRYMEVRDASSTTGSFGYRVDGTAGYSKSNATVSKQNACGTEAAARKAFQEFACFGRNNSQHDRMKFSPAEVAESVVEELQKLRSAFEASAFVQHHECIGTSVLIVFDASSGKCRASWIDFAKTRTCQKFEGLSHRVNPVAGSQEDGVLLGLDNLISAWQVIAQEGQILTKLRTIVGSHPEPCYFGSDAIQEPWSDVFDLMRDCMVPIALSPNAALLAVLAEYTKGRYWLK